MYLSEQTGTGAEQTRKCITQDIHPGSTGDKSYSSFPDRAAKKREKTKKANNLLDAVQVLPQYLVMGFRRSHSIRKANTIATVLCVPKIGLWSLPLLL